nr:BPSS1780 family membrane protein [Undibacterium sp. Jales W-56]
MKLNSDIGWSWVKEGFQLFRKQPVEMLALFFAYMFLTMGIGLIPVLGQFLPLILVPTFSMSFMQACRQIEAGQRVHPNVLLTGFRSPALPRLLMLGLLYLIAAIVAIGASALVDGGAFWDFLTSQKPINPQDPKSMPAAAMFWGMLCSAVVYLPALMAFWFAAPLVAWQNMGVGKAVFYSFFAVRGAGKAFAVYGLAWLGLGVLLPMILSLMVAVIVGKAIAVVIIMMPVSLALTVVMYCSFYPPYTHIFGKHDQLNAE